MAADDEEVNISRTEETKATEEAILLYLLSRRMLSHSLTGTGATVLSADTLQQLSGNDRLLRALLSRLSNSGLFSTDDNIAEVDRAEIKPSFRKQLDSLTSAFYEQRSEQARRIDILEKNDKELKNTVDSLSLQYSSLVEMVCDSFDLSDALSIKRFIPCVVYVKASDSHLGEDWIGLEVKRAVERVCKSVGLESHVENPPQRGSWFQKFILRSSDALSKPIVQEKLEKIERALELKAIDGAQSKVDLELSKAVTQLTNALKRVDEGVVSVGSLFIVKTSTNGVAKLAIMSLTQEQMKLVRVHPDMQTDPSAFHRILKTSTSGTPAESVTSPGVDMKVIENIAAPAKKRRKDETQSK